jgi:hypothetical protein
VQVKVPDGFHAEKINLLLLELASLPSGELGKIIKELGKRKGCENLAASLKEFVGSRPPERPSSSGE